VLRAFGGRGRVNLIYFELILKEIFLVREFAIEAKEALFVG
jgi:hypothetical protein